VYKSKKYFNVLSLLLAVVFLYNSFGYLFFYFPASSLIKYVVSDLIKKNRISEEELIVVTFNLNDLRDMKYEFKWVKPGKEFLYNGKMYDVKSEVITGDKIYYTCFYDTNENILEKLFTDYLNNTKKDVNHNLTGGIFLFGLFCEEIKTNHAQLFENDGSNVRIQKIECTFSNHINDIPTPPPRLIF